MVEQQEKRGTSGFAVSSMVLGILALVFCWLPVVCWILAILAIIFGGVGISKTKLAGGRGMAVAGLVCGIISIALYVILVITVASLGF